jgi:Holliday junction resolvase RusA-like endonuclease
MEQLLPGLEWPALVAGPVFLCFEISGKPQHKARHRQSLMIPKDAWSYTGRTRFITDVGVKKIFIHQYPDPATAAYEKMLKEYAGLLMNRSHNQPAQGPVCLIVHSFREIPVSWSKTDQARALAGNIRPTSRPDWDNYGKITDALNEVVWKDDSQVVDGRSLKYYSDRPALRIEVREMIEPDAQR